jgi:hypothetical protein
MSTLGRAERKSFPRARDFGQTGFGYVGFLLILLGEDWYGSSDHLMRAIDRFE